MIILILLNVELNKEKIQIKFKLLFIDNKLFQLSKFIYFI